MTPDMEKQIEHVRIRWGNLASLPDAGKVVALRTEGWAEAAIQAVAEEGR